MYSDWRPERSVSCPYCGEPFQLLLDTDGEDTDYVEDCPVCCAPIQVAVRWSMGGDEPEVVLRRDDD
ncbi:MAG: CPXCG motif-containing cysteine-rich protein [Halorhodospira halophila]|uniref:CPXCG motif-containing cysteine-rich protein n=1 Tax=Halorhodospira halophila TaxID=1053 RepID=UPI0026EB5BD5|nr:CPXCG motif-containing cysteine-rich protein [Halorhodospira halophila]MCC3751356.1 CPXCG motif-containing cysteine-rich protein [Halorhodospira halophila]